MNRFRTLPMIPALIGGLLIASPRPVLAQPVDLVTVDAKTVAKGYRSSQLIGSPVVNDKDERIGTIEDVVIGKDRDLYAVLQVGGFLGIGGRLIAVPFQKLVLDHPDGKITLPGASRKELAKLPEIKFTG
jgi:hypothetical protein